jgi:hypothetical protein
MKKDWKQPIEEDLHLSDSDQVMLYIMLDKPLFLM